MLVCRASLGRLKVVLIQLSMMNDVPTIPEHKSNCFKCKQCNSFNLGKTTTTTKTQHNNTNQKKKTNTKPIDNIFNCSNELHLWSKLRSSYGVILRICVWEQSGSSIIYMKASKRLCVEQTWLILLQAESSKIS